MHFYVERNMKILEKQETDPKVFVLMNFVLKIDLVFQLQLHLCENWLSLITYVISKT